MGKDDDTAILSSTVNSLQWNGVVSEIIQNLLKGEIKYYCMIY